MSWNAGILQIHNLRKPKKTLKDTLLKSVQTGFGK
jgi:hypothetical protein